MSAELEKRFLESKERVQTLSSRPGNAELLQLYSLFKQGSEGDVQGKRPGMLDIKGRAKYEAWAARKGMGREDAMQAYIDLVDSLFSR